MRPKTASQILSLGEVIRAKRKAAGLTQDAFAATCKLHRTYIGQVERGEKNISFENVMRISKALKMSAAKMFGLAKL